MPLPSARFRGIVFDLDGTLIDSYDAIAQSLNSAMEALGRPTLPTDVVRGMVGRGLEILIERGLGDTATPERVAHGVGLFRRTYDRICVDGTRLLPQVGRTLGILRSRGYRMGVATNKPSYFARRLLEALSVGSSIDAVVGPDLVEHPKPHPEMVLSVLAALGLAPPEALYVGDMEIDVQTARAAGLPVVVMPTGSSSLAALQQAGADLVVPEFSSLLDLLPGPAGPLTC